MTEFTPGPWKNNSGNIVAPEHLVSNRTKPHNLGEYFAAPIANVITREGMPWRANAKLIAETPAMYEALGKIFHQKMKSGNTGFWVSGTNMQEVRAILERIDQ